METEYVTQMIMTAALIPKRDELNHINCPWKMPETHSVFLVKVLGFRICLRNNQTAKSEGILGPENRVSTPVTAVWHPGTSLMASCSPPGCRYLGLA